MAKIYALIVLIWIELFKIGAKSYNFSVLINYFSFTDSNNSDNSFTMSGCCFDTFVFSDGSEDKSYS